jgi:type II secretory pathway component PulC
LPITITGIDWSSNEINSRVSIVNNNTKQSALYKTGDKLFDAYILRIFQNRVLFIRSNGQQEVVYRKPTEAEADLRAIEDPSWTGVVQKQTQTRYLVDPTAFVSRIASVAVLINMLDLTTYSKQGVALGCRIGKMEPTSIGFALGFLPGDIITKINNRAPTSKTARVEIYNVLSTLSLGAKISVELIRAGTPITFEYILQALTQPTIMPAQPRVMSTQEHKRQQNTKAAPVITQDMLTRLAYENTKVLPVVHKSQKQDKQAMAQFGNKGSLMHHVPLQ